MCQSCIQRRPLHCRYTVQSHPVLVKHEVIPAWLGGCSFPVLCNEQYILYNTTATDYIQQNNAQVKPIRGVSANHMVWMYRLCNDISAIRVHKGHLIVSFLQEISGLQ